MMDSTLEVVQAVFNIDEVSLFAHILEERQQILADRREARTMSQEPRKPRVGVREQLFCLSGVYSESKTRSGARLRQTDEAEVRTRQVRTMHYNIRYYRIDTWK